MQNLIGKNLKQIIFSMQFDIKGFTYLHFKTIKQLGNSTTIDLNCKIKDLIDDFNDPKYSLDFYLDKPSRT